MNIIVSFALVAIRYGILSIIYYQKRQISDQFAGT